MESAYTGLIGQICRDSSPHKVSILLESDHTGLETDRARIVLRDLLDRVDTTELPSSIGEWLADLARSSRSPSFWRDHRAPGMAMFRSEELQLTLDLPRAPARYAGVGSAFRVLEVYEAAQEPFYLILAVSAGAARVLRLGGGSAVVLDVPGMPADLDEVAKFADLEPSLQRHATARGGTVTSHGQEGGSRQLDHLRDRYLRSIDAAITDDPELRRLPVILAGVEAVTAAYRAISALPHVAEQTIQGNHDRTSAWQLAALAEDIARPENPMLARDRNACADPHRKTETDVDHVFRHAHDGRIEAVFLAADDSRRRHLLDEIATAVSLHGGRVWILDDGPVEAEALLRY